MLRFGARVREIRTKKFESVYQVTGEDMPIKSRQHWQSIENGKKNLSLTTIFGIARTLDIELHELFKNL